MLFKALAKLQTPVWVYDIECFEMVWANQAALMLWGVDTLEQLVSRDFTEVTSAIQVKPPYDQATLVLGEPISTTWTISSEGETVMGVQCICSGIELKDGRTALLVEGSSPRPLPVASDMQRLVEIFRHTGSLISLFTLDGEMLTQNLAAIAAYGRAANFADRFKEKTLAQSALHVLRQRGIWQEDCEVYTQRGLCWHRVELRKIYDPLSHQDVCLLDETDITDLKRLAIERQRMHLNAQASIQKHETVLKALAEGIVMQGANGQILVCNDSAQKILGLAPDQMPGWSSDPRWRVVREDGSPFPQEAQPAMLTLRTGEAQRNVVMGVYKPGDDLIWLSVNTQPVWKFGRKTPNAVVVSFSDITACKNAEMAQRNKEERWQFAFEGSGDGLWDWNLQTNRVFFSSRWKTMLGYADHETDNTFEGWNSYVHPQDQAQRNADLQRHFRGETPIYRNEHRVQCQDGTYRWILDRGKVVDWSDTGKPLRIVGTYTDVTERHEMEDALRRQAEMLQVIVGHIPIMLIFFDHHGTIQFINQTLEDTLGWSLQEWQEQDRVVECYPDPNILKQVLAQRRVANGQWCDYKTRTAAGQVIDIAWANICLSDGCCIGIGQEITHRKHIEETQRQQALRDRIMMGLSQRISQSLNLINVLETAVTETRQILNAHRVLVCKIGYKERRGTTMAAALNTELQFLNNAEVCEHCSVNQGTTSCVLLSGIALEQPSIHQIRNVPDIYAAELADFEISALEKFQVRAFLAIPILQNEQLWGVLIAQNCTVPREWQSWEVHMLRQLADQLSIAVQQAELYQQLQQANEELHYLATHDKLTGIANRRHFDTYLEQEWRRHIRDRASLSIILCDIDHFKLYNDTFGHVAGDECLLKVAQAIKRSVKRPADLAARYGGEEFAIILPNTNLAGACQTAERIRMAINDEHINHSSSPVRPQVTLSAGIACVEPSLELSIEDVVSMADEALYKAKNGGRDRFCMAQ